MRRCVKDSGSAVDGGFLGNDNTEVDIVDGEIRDYPVKNRSRSSKNGYQKEAKV